MHFSAPDFFQIQIPLPTDSNPPSRKPPKSKLLISGSKSLLAAPDDTIQFPISNPTNLLR